jgi:predicted glycoside hydrolase/deacetylase ChbG (UPF0249 family)
MKIIINADDLGLSVPVNDAIFALMDERRITSATVLANAPGLEDAATRLTERPHCSFGAHLNLSEFKPLSGHADLHPILDEQGSFAGNRLREIKIDSKLREAIFVEWSAQLDRLYALKIPVSHIDSHHHMHTVPELLPVVKRLQEKFRIKRVRISMNIYDPTQPTPRLRLATKVIWNTALRHWHKTVTTERFTSFEIFSKFADSGYPKCATIELMVHPGGPDFDAETALLWGPWLQEMKVPAQLISYNELT